MKRIGDKTLSSIADHDCVKCIQIGKRGAKGGVLTPEAEASVARIRTDLDYFNAYEVSALVINGLRNALSVLVPDRVLPLGPMPFLPNDQVPNEKLIGANKRKLLSFDASDWTSYVVLAFVLTLAAAILTPLALLVTAFVAEMRFYGLDFQIFGVPIHIGRS